VLLYQSLLQLHQTNLCTHSLVQQVCLIMYSGLQQPSLTTVELGSKELLSIRASHVCGCIHGMHGYNGAVWSPALPATSLSRIANFESMEPGANSSRGDCMTLSTTHEGRERHFTTSAGTTTNPVHVFTDASRGRVSRRLYECPQLATLSDRNKSKAFFLCNEMSYGSIESTC
jgi:hypothetical protein